MNADVVIPLWLELREYAGRLVADLDDADMVSQPVAGTTMNHPAWVLSHLSTYGPILTGILRGESVVDPIDHPFGRNSSPAADPAVYPSRVNLLMTFQTVYDEAADAWREAPNDRLESPTPIARWLPRFPRIIDLPTQFLVKHNAVHLGQVSAWRRAGGRPPV